ncbi:hypothetical protein QE392_001782 [Microbacterium proteolyticum]|nr:hypothetical protein [Microbacterium proteolyticum]
MPVQAAGLFGPESLAVGGGALVQRTICHRLVGECGRRRETAGFGEKVIDLAAHRGAPSHRATPASVPGVVIPVTLSSGPDGSHLR